MKEDAWRGSRRRNWRTSEIVPQMSTRYGVQYGVLSVRMCAHSRCNCARGHWDERKESVRLAKCQRRRPLDTHKSSRSCAYQRRLFFSCHHRPPRHAPHSSALALVHLCLTCLLPPVDSPPSGTFSAARARSHKSRDVPSLALRHRDPHHVTLSDNIEPSACACSSARTGRRVYAAAPSAWAQAPQ